MLAALKQVDIHCNGINAACDELDLPHHLAASVTGLSNEIVAAIKFVLADYRKNEARRTASNGVACDTVNGSITGVLAEKVNYCPAVGLPAVRASLNGLAGKPSQAQQAKIAAAVKLVQEDVS